MAQVQLLPMMQEMQKSLRTTRQPFHPYYVINRPMQIVPVTAAMPVLANETMVNLKMESRVVSDPLVNPLQGASMEYYLFYVKLTDLVAIEDSVRAMITSPFTPYVNATAADPLFYHNGGGVNWTKLCYDRIIETYFRTEQESATDFTVDGYALASLRRPHTGPFDSIAEAANVTGLSDLGDLTSSTALDQALEAYQLLKDNGLINMNYEDYQRMVGVRVPKEEDHEPELLWTTRQWSYPTNTVEPTTGIPSSAMSYVFDATAKSRKVFKEWGFLLGLSVYRPKWMRTNQAAAVSHFFDRGVSWIPSVLNPDPATSIRIFADSATDGPLGTSQAAGYALDMSDLLRYGDQFTNTTTGFNGAFLPHDGVEARFLVEANIDAIFSGANKTIRQDGYFKPSILGQAGPDHTGQNLAMI